MSPEAVTVDDSMDDESIDEDQLDEYKDELRNLGEFPDKVKINSLSIIAGDHASSKSAANAIYRTIRDLLLKSDRQRILPLVYVIDSILKNVKGFYISVIQEDAEKWLPIVSSKLDDEQRSRLKKVWQTWNEAHLFDVDKWKAMGRCFNAEASSGNPVAVSVLQPVAGIARMANGSLIIPSKLRGEMQSVLDELQQNMTNELDKVSLERLADINPELLGEIKRTATENLNTGENFVQQNSSIPDHRSEAQRSRTEAWRTLEWDPKTQCGDVMSKLQEIVSSGAEQSYTPSDAVDIIQCCASALATSSVLSAALSECDGNVKFGNSKSSSDGPVSGASSLVFPTSFDKEGLKRKNPAVVALLYEATFPFQSSADGRRFRTLVDLHNHLDYLFNQNQKEKVVSTAEERGWYDPEEVWCGQVESKQITTASAGSKTEVPAEPSKEELWQEPADEDRDRCVICGRKFDMVFDEDQGSYFYSKCREIKVELDDAAEKDSELSLVHVACWQGLGSPESLTSSQVIQDMDYS